MRISHLVSSDIKHIWVRGKLTIGIDSALWCVFNPRAKSGLGDDIMRRSAQF